MRSHDPGGTWHLGPIEIYIATGLDTHFANHLITGCPRCSAISAFHPLIGG